MSRNRNKNVFAFVVLFAVLAFVTVGCASASTYTICPCGCNYTSIQAAINAAEPGDTIEVHSGTYYENVDVTKQLILKGMDTGSGKSVIDAGGIGSAITLSADGITLEGFTVTNSESSWFYAGIKVTSNSNIITGNNASNNGGFGVVLNYSSNNAITDNNISNNNYDGIYLSPSSNNNTITDNNASSNRAFGIHLYYSSNNNTITGNNASSNRASGIRLYHSSNNIITGNIVCNNDACGLRLRYSSNINNITSNIVCNNNDYGISLIYSSNNKIYLNNFINNNDGIYSSSSNNNIITGNNVSNNNRYGIYSSNNNIITGNNVSNNKYGIYLSYSYNSLIFHNNLINNSNNAYDRNPANNGWHHPVILEGNYWSDYIGIDDGSGTGKHSIADDGIGDTDIPHPGTNYDNYPFMNESGWLIQREHDIAVTSIDAPKFAEPNSTTCINSTICNVGLNNESEIIVDFLVDGIKQSNTTIPFLESWNSRIVSFQWTAPNVTDLYSLTIYTEPVSGENITRNNRLSKNISVINLIIHNNNTGENFSSIQEGIDDSDTKEGHTITVTSGIYYENVKVTKQLILRGVNTGNGKPVVDAGGSGNAITLSADGITLKELTAINSDDFDKAGIKVTSNNNTITGNTASNNYNGIYLHNSRNNTITGNTANNNGLDGIHIHDSCNNTITGNTANNNYNGVILSFSSNSTLRNNTMSNNRYNFKHEGRVSSRFDHDIDTSNLVDGKPIYYLAGASGTIIDSSTNAGTVCCVNCDSVTVKDLALTNNSYGIYFYNTSNSSIQNNHISNNYYNGICLDFFSSNNTITGNTANNSEYGIRLSYSRNNTITGNNACNNRFYGIRFDYSNNNNLTANNASDNYNGIYHDYSGNNNITGNTASTNRAGGISLVYSSNNNITGNTASTNSADGIRLSYSRNSTITGNNASNNDDGIYLGVSSNNTITGNNACNNDWMGIHFSESSNNNNITGNNVSNNNYNGIRFFESNNNKIYLNNFINNRDNVHSEESKNIWYSTEPITYQYDGGEYTNHLGNYWSDYIGEDANKNGIGDTPYSIYTVKDNYPLMETWGSYFASVPLVFNTGSGTYPGIMETHKGKIKPLDDLNVSNLSSYPRVGTGRHIESIELEENSIAIANGTWNGYRGDYHNITIPNVSSAPYVMLYSRLVAN